MPDDVERCVNIIAHAVNDLRSMYPEIEKIRLEEILELSEHAEKLHNKETNELKEEIDALRAGLKAICSEALLQRRRTLGY